MRPGAVMAESARFAKRCAHSQGKRCHALDSDSDSEDDDLLTTFVPARAGRSSIFSKRILPPVTLGKGRGVLRGVMGMSFVSSTCELAMCVLFAQAPMAPGSTETVHKLAGMLHMFRCEVDPSTIDWYCSRIIAVVTDQGAAWLQCVNFRVSCHVSLGLGLYCHGCHKVQSMAWRTSVGWIWNACFKRKLQN